MNRAYNGAASTRETLESGGNFICHEGVQATRRLVEEDDGRLGDQRKGDVDPLTLPTADAALESISDDSVLALLEAESIDDFLNAREFLRLREVRRQPQLGSVHEHLLHGELCRASHVVKPNISQLAEGGYDRPEGFEALSKALPPTRVSNCST